MCYSPPLLAGFRCLWWCAVPRHSWLGPAGGGGAWRVVCGVWCVVCGGGVLVGLWLWLVPRHSWWRFLCSTPRHSWLGFDAGGGGRSSPLLAEGSGRGFPPLLAGVRLRRWCVVGLWLVCGVFGPSPLLAEVPVCYSPPLLAGFRCLWWCAVPRHSWLGPAGGGGAWRVVCGVWCVVCGGGVLVGLWLWLVPRHSWRRFLCSTPRHSWLGFDAGGGGRSSPLLAEGPGRGSPPLLAGDRWRRRCVVGFWLVCGVVGLSPPLAELPVCYSPPLLAGFRCRWWCAVSRHSWLGPAGGGGAWCVVCGVRRWCVGGVVGGVWCGWSLATPGGGSCVLLPATPGWVSLPVVVGGPRHSWLGSAGGGGVWCVAVVCWLLVPRHSWRRFLCATPRHSWLGFAAGGGGRSPPLLAGVRWRRWCVVCGGGVLVVGPSPLLAEVPVCYSPPLLAGFRCRRWWAFLATPGGGSRARFPATPGWVSLSAVVRGVRCVVCGVWRAAVACVVCLSLVWLVPRHSWRRFLCVTPRHSWLGFAACGVVRLPATPGWVSLPVVVCGFPPLLAGACWRWWCVVCGVWCAAVVCWRGCGWCMVWLVPRHSWRRFLCATPRHSWLGFAAGGGGRSPPLLAGVRWQRWCVVCGGCVLVVGPSPLLAEVPVCYSPPLLAGFRCRWWWAVPATPGWGPLAAVVCGVWRWCVGCWSLATPGGGSFVLLPATPG